LITIIDYGAGNLRSVANALEFLKVSFEITGDPKIVCKSDCLLLPGVGSFRVAMHKLNKDGLSNAIKEAVLVRNRKILGVCLGLQLMGMVSTEDGLTGGLGLIKGSTDSFSDEELAGLNCPHIGFNSVKFDKNQILFRGLKQGTDFYFLHSYRMLPKGLSGKIATCVYGTNFVAAYEQDNIFATQFHPEKSQTNGLQLLKNFCSI
jgi:glutamine amidotransferase